MDFKEKMNEYNSFSNEEKYTKVMNLLNLMKQKNSELEEVYQKLSNTPNIDINVINDIYKVILEAMVYQNWLNEKEAQLRIQKMKEKLNNYLEEEKREKEEELKDIEGIFNY